MMMLNQTDTNSEPYYFLDNNYSTKHYSQQIRLLCKAVLEEQPIINIDIKLIHNYFLDAMDLNDFTSYC